ncbi:NosD domain-containing protein [Bacillus spongiae]|uniref:NosD domain-containing protein n=1 Tax=Bacillus spongiae TaxID=2683610 RepID=A0ABU8HIR1_9BACI
MVLRIVPTVAFPTVQDAIDASSSGDSIKILTGKFDGFEVTIDNLKIFGCGIGRTIIEGAPAQGSNNGVVVSGDRTILQGFTVQGFEDDGIEIFSDNNVVKNIESKFNLGPTGSGFAIVTNSNLIVNCIASFNNRGFDITGQHNCIQKNNSFQNLDSGYIILNRNNILNKNLAKNNEVGFLIITDFNNLFTNSVLNNKSNGIQLTTTADNNNIIVNILCNNEGNGIFLNGSPEQNVIDSNIVRNNGTANTNAGILIQNGAFDNTIRFNKARNNVEFDIEAEPGAEPPNNTFDGNKCGNSSPPGLCT